MKSVPDTHRGPLTITADLDNARPLAYKRFRQRATVYKEERPGSEVHPVFVVQDRLQCHLYNAMSPPPEGWYHTKEDEP